MQWHFKTLQGIRNLAATEAVCLVGTDPGYAQRALFDAIAGDNHTTQAASHACAAGHRKHIGMQAGQPYSPDFLHRQPRKFSPKITQVLIFIAFSGLHGRARS